MPGEEKQQGYAFGTAITTPRLILRPATPEDRALMAALAANPHVAENLSADPSAMPGESGETFAVVEKRSGTVVGAASYGPMVERRASVEVAAWIGQPFWGRGYATEATQAIVRYGFHARKLPGFTSSHFVDNWASAGVLRKLGFERVGGGYIISVARGYDVEAVTYWLSAQQAVHLPPPRMKVVRDGARWRTWLGRLSGGAA